MDWHFDAWQPYVPVVTVFLMVHVSVLWLTYWFGMSGRVIAMNGLLK